MQIVAYGKRAVGVCCGKRLRVIKVFTTVAAFFLVTRSYQLLQDGSLQNTKHVVRKLSTLISSDFGQSQSRQRLLSPVDRLVAEYSVDFSYPLDPGQSPWQLADSWVTGRELYPQRARQLGAVLHAMATAPLKVVDVDAGGTQLKLRVTMAGGQRAVFKPTWYARDDVISGKCAGYDRPNAEIVAFHISRVLGFRRTPLAVGRVLKVSRDIKPVATERLLKTFYQSEGNETCFYGQCLACKKENSICTADDRVEGALILWVPEKIQLHNPIHPWGLLCYKDPAWASQPVADQCSAIVKGTPALRRNFQVQLDFVDAAIFLYIIGNDDRKFYIGKNHYKNLMIAIDNGKGLAHPDVDRRQLLAPLYFCCYVRRTTYDQLVRLQNGTLSKVMEEVLRADPIHPLLTLSHLHAMDRRLANVLHEIRLCMDSTTPEHVLRD